MGKKADLHGNKWVDVIRVRQEWIEDKYWRFDWSDYTARPCQAPPNFAKEEPCNRVEGAQIPKKRLPLAIRGLFRGRVQEALFGGCLGASRGQAKKRPG